MSSELVCKIFQILLYQCQSINICCIYSCNVFQVHLLFILFFIPQLKSQETHKDYASLRSFSQEKLYFLTNHILSYIYFFFLSPLKNPPALEIACVRGKLRKKIFEKAKRKKLWNFLLKIQGYKFIIKKEKEKKLL